MRFREGFFPLCCLSLLLRRVAEKTNAGIVWGDGRKLADLDYADDIVLISEGTDEMQKVLDCIVKEGRKVGLIIKCAKTEMINMNIANPRACVIGERVVKQVEKV